MKAKDCVETSAKTKMQSKYIINPMKALLLKINSEFCLTKTRNNIRDEMTKTRIKLVFIQKNRRNIRKRRARMEFER